MKVAVNLLHLKQRCRLQAASSRCLRHRLTPWEKSRTVRTKRKTSLTTTTTLQSPRATLTRNRRQRQQLNQVPHPSTPSVPLASANDFIELSPDVNKDLASDSTLSLPGGDVASSMPTEGENQPAAATYVPNSATSALQQQQNPINPTRDTIPALSVLDADNSGGMSTVEWLAWIRRFERRGQNRDEDQGSRRQELSRHDRRGPLLQSAEVRPEERQRGTCRRAWKPGQCCRMRRILSANLHLFTWFF